MNDASPAERYFLRKAEEVAQAAASVSAEVSALRVRVEEQGRSIQDLRNRHEHPFVSLMRWLISMVMALFLGAFLYALYFGEHHAS